MPSTLGAQEVPPGERQVYYGSYFKRMHTHTARDGLPRDGIDTDALGAEVRENRKKSFAYK